MNNVYVHYEDEHVKMWCVDWMAFSCAPYWGPGPQPRHVSWQWIEPATIQFVGWHSTHWDTPVRAGPFLYFLLSSVPCSRTDSSFPLPTRSRPKHSSWLLLQFGPAYISFSILHHTPSTSSYNNPVISLTHKLSSWLYLIWKASTFLTGNY